MTAQTGEIVQLEDQEYRLAGVDGRGLFDPQEHGIVTHSVTSACWRGFVSTYEVSEGRLWLAALSIGFHTPPGTEPPPVFGVKPERESPEWPYWRYARLRRPVDFTGGFLIGRDFIQELYVHMGYHPGYTYRNVKEILFEEGRVMELIDRSAEMAVLREDMVGKMGPGRGPGVVAGWVQQRFSLRYTARRGNGEPFRHSHPMPDSPPRSGAFGELDRRMLDPTEKGDASMPRPSASQPGSEARPTPKPEAS